MAIARWHGGKIALLWAGTLVLFLGSRSYDLELDAGYWIVAAVVSSIVTWTWFTAREGTVPRIASNAPGMSPPVLGQTIAEQLWAHCRKPDKAIEELLEGTKLQKATVLLREVLALRSRAAHVAVAQAVAGNEARAAPILDHLYSALAQKDAAGLTGKELVEFLIERGQDYGAALTITTDNEAFFRLMARTSEMTWSGNPAQDVGKLFTYHAGCPKDVRVQLAGTTMFMETLQETRVLLSS